MSSEPEEENGRVRRRGVFASAGLWALVLGAVGFVCGFFGPITFSPDANQGPLLGILITGPGGALLGAVLGFLVGFLPISARRAFSALVVAAVLLAGVTLYLSMPSPQYRAEIVEAEIRGCDSPIALKEKSFEYWEDRFAKVTWAKPREGWQDDFDRMVREDQGVVLRTYVVRKSALYENLKPWNKGSMTARPWQGKGEEQQYFTRRWGGSCSDYPVGQRDLFLAKGETAGQWPPLVLSNFLGLQVLEPVPDGYRRLLSH